jgi:hypothetical protein
MTQSSWQATIYLSRATENSRNEGQDEKRYCSDSAYCRSRRNRWQRASLAEVNPSFGEAIRQNESLPGDAEDE